MKSHRHSVGRFSSGLILIALGAVSLCTAATGSYHLLKKYSFGAAEGSTREYFDYITVDSAARRVYLSHGTEVKVLDADSGALIGNITGLKVVGGGGVGTGCGGGLISEGARGEVIFFDVGTLK